MIATKTIKKTYMFHNIFTEASSATIFHVIFFWSSHHVG